MIAVAFLTAALLSYVLFFRDSVSRPTLTGDVRLIIEAPPDSPAGSELSYKISIENLSNVKLQNLNLEIFYPRGFTFIDSTPDSASSGESQAAPRQFSFPDLEPNQKHQLVIVGQLSGIVQEIKVLSAKLHYVPENFRSTFIAESSATTQMSPSQLALNLAAPAHLVSGQTIAYEVQITNVAQRDFADVAVRLTYPDKFEFIEAEPSPLQDRNLWALGSFAPGSSKKIKVAGKIFENPGAESFIQAEILIKDESNNLISAGRSFAFTKIRSSPLVLTHRLVSPTQAILPGSELNYEIFYQNAGELGLNNVSIFVVLSDPRILELDRLSGEKVQVKNNAAVYFPAVVSELRVVNPGQKGTLRFTVPVSRDLTANLIKNPQFSSRVEFASQEFTEPIVGNSLDYKIATQAKVAATATFLGENRYRVDLAVSNTVNDLEEAELRAAVPLVEASFVSESLIPIEEQPNVNYNQSAGILSWNLGTVFAFSGSFHEPRRLSFEIVLTDEGAIKPVMLKEIQFTGVDQFTGSKIVSNRIESLSAQ